MDPHKDLNAQVVAAAKTLDRARLLKYFETNDSPGLRAEFESFDRVTALAAWGLLVKQEDEPRDIYLVRVGWVHALVSPTVIRAYADFIDESNKRERSDLVRGAIISGESGALTTRAAMRGPCSTQGCSTG